MGEFTARQSFIRSAQECGRRAWHDYHAAGDARGYSEARAALGTVFHDVAAECFQTMYRVGERSISTEEALVIAREVQAKSGIILPTAEQEELRMLVLRFASEYTWPIERLLQVEQGMIASLVCPDGVTRRITGRPDAIFASSGDTCTIVDHKTGFGTHLRSPRHQQPEVPDGVAVGKEYLSAQGFTQLHIYGLLAMREYPACQRVMLFEVYPRTGDKRQAFLGRDELEHVEVEVATWLQQIDTGLAAGADHPTWRPRAGSHCARACSVARSCPIPLEQRGRGGIEDQASADAAAAALVVVDAQRGQLRDSLKSWFAETGQPAYIGDGRCVRFDGGKGGAFTIADVESAET